MSNIHKFKIASKSIECVDLLDIDSEVIWQGSGTVIGHSVKTLNKDGERQITAIIEPMIIDVKKENIGYEPTPVFQGELKKNSQSKKIRDRLYILWTEQGAKGDFETFYKDKTDLILENIDEEIDEMKMEGLV